MSVTTKGPSPSTVESAGADEAEAEAELSAAERRQRQIERNQPLIALLAKWREEDLAAGEDGSEALEEFMRAIDSNRIPGSKLFEKYYS